MPSLTLFIYPEYIILLGKNGGSTIRVIEAGLPGAPSTTLVDLKLDFSREGYERLSVAKDLAFVERDGKTYLVMPSGTEHKVGIVDFEDNFKVTHVTFSDKPFENGAPHGRYRGVEWAVGTDYVWTNDSSEDEHYVIDVVNAKLVKTITGIARSEIVSVQNWDRVREHFQQEDMMVQVRAMQDEVAGTSPLGVAALIIGCLALLVGTANLYVLYEMKNNGSQQLVGTAKLVTGVPSTVDAEQGRPADAPSVTSSVQKSLA